MTEHRNQNVCCSVKCRDQSEGSRIIKTRYIKIKLDIETIRSLRDDIGTWLTFYPLILIYCTVKNLKVKSSIDIAKYLK